MGFDTGGNGGGWEDHDPVYRNGLKEIESEQRVLTHVKFCWDCLGESSHIGRW